LDAFADSLEESLEEPPELDEPPELEELDVELVSDVELALLSAPDELFSPDSLLWARFRASEG